MSPNIIAKGRQATISYSDWKAVKAAANKILRNQKLQKLIKAAKRTVPVASTVVALASLNSDIQAKGLVGGLANTALDAIPGLNNIKFLAETYVGEDLIPNLRRVPVTSAEKNELKELTNKLTDGRTWHYRREDGTLSPMIHGTHLYRMRKFPDGVEIPSGAMVYDNLTKVWVPYDESIWEEMFYPEELAKKLLGYKHDLGTLARKPPKK